MFSNKIRRKFQLFSLSHLEWKKNDLSYVTMTSRKSQERLENYMGDIMFNQSPMTISRINQNRFIKATF